MSVVAAAGPDPFASMHYAAVDDASSPRLNLRGSPTLAARFPGLTKKVGMGGDRRQVRSDVLVIRAQIQIETAAQSGKRSTRLRYPATYNPGW
jgi:hypothetical protein